MVTSKTELPVDWPELDEWCERQLVVSGVDMAHGEDLTTVWIVDQRKPDDIHWYLVSAEELAILYSRRPRRVSGDIEQMIRDMDGVELTPKTRFGMLQQRVDQRLHEELCGIAILQEIGKL